MNERKAIEQELNLIEQGQRELEIRYEQYFAGVEKREPVQGREEIARRLRRLSVRRIIQTDLRYRYQNLATRFHSYGGYWDRILRLMDEGRSPRQSVCKSTPSRTAPPPPSGISSEPADEVETVYRQLLEAHRQGSAAGAPPERRAVAAFLEKQKALIREKFGEREIEFLVETENGKPKIKVRARK